MNKLRLKARRLKKNKLNTKWLLVELMKISHIDFSVEHAGYKLYKYGFGNCSRDLFKWMTQLCDEGTCVFVGYKPEKVADRIVGYEPVFGLIRHAK